MLLMDLLCKNLSEGTLGSAAFAASKASHAYHYSQPLIVSACDRVGY
jgi:hypothetical protein